MKYFLSFVFLFTYTISSFGQADKIMELYTQGNSFYNAGKYDQAIEYYSKFIEATDEPRIIKRGYINRGLALDKLGNYDKAVEDFTEAIKLDSTDMASFIDRALALYHANKFEDARGDFDYVVELDTNKQMKENALYWLAQIDYKSGNMDQVIEHSNMFLKSNPKDPEVIFIRASAYSMLREFEKSIDDYTRIINLYPEAYQAYANRGIAKINQLTANGNLQPSKKETKNACKDLRKAQAMGDSTVGDMIFIYCKNKKD